VLAPALAALAPGVWAPSAWPAPPRSALPRRRFRASTPRAHDAAPVRDRDARGVLVYAGAIDDRPSSNAADIPGATNHLKAALGELAAGTQIKVPLTRPYG
jgi:hypothetical protein